MRKAQLVLTLGFICSAACDPIGGDEDNDLFAADVMESADPSTGTPAAPAPGNPPPATPPGTPPGPGQDAGGSTTPPAPGPEQDASTPATDSGTAPPAASTVAGSYVGCTSYGEQNGELCAGYYCNVTAADLAAELPTSGPCGTLEPDRVCGGSLTREVGSCSRSVKSNPLNAFDNDETLRGKIQDCVYNNEDIRAVVTEQCLSCFLDAAQCASDNCLTQCLAGDSAACDSCRLDNNCNQTVPPCGGLPSPF